MTNETETAAEIVDYLKRDIFGAGVALDATTNLVEAGFDSLSLAKLLLFIEERFGFWIPESEITEEALQSASSLATLVVRLADA